MMLLLVQGISTSSSILVRVMLAECCASVIRIVTNSSMHVTRSMSKYATLETRRRASQMRSTPPTPGSLAVWEIKGENLCVRLVVTNHAGRSTPVVQLGSDFSFNLKITILHLGRNRFAVAGTGFFQRRIASLTSDQVITQFTIRMAGSKIHCWQDGAPSTCALTAEDEIQKRRRRDVCAALRREASTGLDTWYAQS